MVRFIIPLLVAAAAGFSTVPEVPCAPPSAPPSLPEPYDCSTVAGAVAIIEIFKASTAAGCNEMCTNNFTCWQTTPECAAAAFSSCAPGSTAGMCHHSRPGFVCDGPQAMFCKQTCLPCIACTEPDPELCPMGCQNSTIGCDWDGSETGVACMEYYGCWGCDYPLPPPPPGPQVFDCSTVSGASALVEIWEASNLNPICQSCETNWTCWQELTEPECVAAVLASCADGSTEEICLDDSPGFDCESEEAKGCAATCSVCSACPETTSSAENGRCPVECLTGAACDWDGDDTPGGTACLNYVGCFGCDYSDVTPPVPAGRRSLGNKLAEGFVPPFFVNKVKKTGQPAAKTLPFFAGKSA